MKVWQKLLMPWQTERIAVDGQYWVGGAVLDATDAAGLSTPAALVEAYGLVGAGRVFGPDASVVPYVDVLRFAGHPLLEVQRPPGGGDLDGAAGRYPQGFLSSGTPVWWLERTRVPVGTEVWRIEADGTQKAVAVFGGIARGWRGGRGFLAPTDLVGPRASYRGSELPADLVLGEDGAVREVELVAVSGAGAAGPEGFEEVRPQVWARRVPVGECESVFEVRLTCTWREVPCRILLVAGAQVVLQLLDSGPEAVAATGADLAEPGIYEVVAPTAEIADQLGTTRELS